MYQNIMGIYLIPAGLTADERAKSTNIYPISLGPHSTNFSDVIASLQQLRTLDTGVDAGGINLVAFCLAFLANCSRLLFRGHATAGG
jgi:hypothetical protein